MSLCTHHTRQNTREKSSCYFSARSRPHLRLFDVMLSMRIIAEFNVDDRLAMGCSSSVTSYCQWEVQVAAFQLQFRSLSLTVFQISRKPQVALALMHNAFLLRVGIVSASAIAGNPASLLSPRFEFWQCSSIALVRHMRHALCSNFLHFIVARPPLSTS